MTREKLNARESPWKNAQVVAAAVAAIAAVVVALINLSGGDDGGTGSHAGATTQPPAASSIELLHTGTAPANPPPATLFWFEGRVSELKANQRVFVFGYFDEMPPQTGGQATGSSQTGQPVSPPAQYFPGGRWRVDWRFEDVPRATRFEAVLVELPTTADGGNPGGTQSAAPTAEPTGPPRTGSPTLPRPDDTLSKIIRDRLLRSGPTNRFIVARDEIRVGPGASARP